jgi:hypothetical protein
MATELDVHVWDVLPGDRTVPQQESPHRLEWWSWRDELLACGMPIPTDADFPSVALAP